MPLTIYNDVSLYISQIIKSSRFFEEGVTYDFKYIWGYQPIVPKINQNIPYFFAWIKNIRSKNVTPIQRELYMSEQREYCFEINNNYELEVELAFRQQQHIEEMHPNDPRSFEEERFDGSLLLSEIVAGMWNDVTTNRSINANIGFTRAGMINNHSEIVSARYVREWRVTLFFDTVQKLEHNAGIIERIYLDGTESDTGNEFEFILETPDE